MDACIKLPHTLVKVVIDVGKSDAGSELVCYNLISSKSRRKGNKKKKKERNKHEKRFQERNYKNPLALVAAAVTVQKSLLDKSRSPPL